MTTVHAVLTWTATKSHLDVQLLFIRKFKYAYKQQSRINGFVIAVLVALKYKDTFTRDYSGTRINWAKAVNEKVIDRT